MNKSMIVKEEVLFKASPGQVWDLLINPAMTKQYMFGCEVISDWKIGSPVYWKGKTENGNEVIYVKGEVLAFQEGIKVTTTTFDPNAGMEDIPANYVELSYEISKVEGGTLLKIMQGDFSMAAEGEKRFKESQTGWKEIVIPIMKKLLYE